ncbi:hypothetical protein [Prosthecobacter sp.]
MKTSTQFPSRATGGHADAETLEQSASLVAGEVPEAFPSGR